jgi:hypothetical protein
VGWNPQDAGGPTVIPQVSGRLACGMGWNPQDAGGPTVIPQVSGRFAWP